MKATDPVKKKILHVVNISFVLPYFIGDQFDYFTDKDYTFFVACQPSEHLFKYADEKKFKAYGVNIAREINPLKDIVALYLIYKIIKKERIDIVVGHTPKGGILSMCAAFLAGIKHRIYFRHGIMFETSRGLKRSLLKFIESCSGKLATKVVCVSPSVINFSIENKLNGVDKNVLLNKGTCNGIDSNGVFNPQNKNTDDINRLKHQLGISLHHRVVGYVGRLVKDKGITELINAWQILKGQHRDVKLLLVGPFEQRDSVSREIKDLIANDSSIIHTGLVDDTSIYYSVMNLFILPSFREGFPTVVLEGSSMEIPVLTTRSTGCVDSIVNNHTGKFIDIEPQSIANAIGVYLDNAELAAEHGKNGRKFVSENFEQSIVWKELLTKVYN